MTLFVQRSIQHIALLNSKCKILFKKNINYPNYFQCNVICTQASFFLSFFSELYTIIGIRKKDHVYLSIPVYIFYLPTHTLDSPQRQTHNSQTPFNFYFNRQETTLSLVEGALQTSFPMCKCFCLYVHIPHPTLMFL